MITKLTLFLSTTAIVLAGLCCKTESTPPAPSAQLQIKVDTLRLSGQDSIWAIGGPGYYWKPFTVQNHQFSPLWGDSVVNVLLDANVALVEFWYPADGGICHAPYTGMMEISRLNHPDSVMYRIGYVDVSQSPGVSLSCVRLWRHYTVVR